MVNIFSCRVGLFKSLDTAFKSLPEAGILHAEVDPPSDGDYASLSAKASAAGITIATLSTGLNLDTDETTAMFLPVIDGAAAIGVPKIFVSAKAQDSVPWQKVLMRLRRTAAYAAGRGVTICLETHPPYGTNGDVARQTMKAVDSPGLRYNFDTANVYYYNQGTDSVTELLKIKEYVASVHIKETDGGYHSPRFPALGEGVVKFAEVFRILLLEGFIGPYTLEIEGDVVQNYDDNQRLEFLKKCVGHMRSLGVMKA